MLLAIALVASLARTARADEPVLLGVEGGVTIPLASPQSERFGPGGTLALALHTPVNEWLIPTFRLRGLLLSDGPPPADTSLRDPGVGAAYALTIGLRLRPEGWFSSDLQRARGAWIEIDAGGVLTGDIVRPGFEVGLGWDFEIDDVRLGPLARFQHVMHFDDPLDDRPAYLLTVGMEWVFFDRRVPPPPPEVPPRGDRDRDGLYDDEDGCPDEPEDDDDFEDEDGCPELDNDRDGFPDASDPCPIEPEDLDGFEDEGCPELDNDRDGFLDPRDACPNEAEVVNGVDDDDGCPDEGLIQMIDDRIVLEETVLFDFQRARVKHSAQPVLAAIVELYRQHPEWMRVRVEGHADTRGDAEYNQELSERRAEHVRDELVELGMPSEIIEVVGYGTQRPRDTRDTEEAHARNRRVEFVVVARSGPPEGETP
ncbi:OmpA family protein [Sandaracinus amylolyticus]|uniref:Flagellar motor rotation protein MotB n=1 Tax=Sandaracinus amylolyticus TaxID=927083 RepID=A0A0F6SFB4_9BACT|nr:OmpA family protein [Sandaracinus amylolyticus]AKF06649.1 Flagellar motor rotation protein MotB [Sandaracinus amylolyticus]